MGVPSVTSNRGWPPRYADRPGQGPLRKFSALTWIRGIGGFAQLFSGEVPGEFWSEDVSDAVDVSYVSEEVGDQRRIGIVSCMCGETPSVPDNGIAICPGEGCGRVFLLLGDTIRVAKLDAEALQEALD